MVTVSKVRSMHKAAWLVIGLVALLSCTSAPATSSAESPTLTPQRSATAITSTPAVVLTSTATPERPMLLDTSPSCEEDSEHPRQIDGPGEMRGIVCGLQPGDSATLVLRKHLEGEQPSNPVLEIPVQNGPWSLTRLDLEPGFYTLGPADQELYLTTPVNRFVRIPDKGVVWRFSHITFEFVRRDKVVERFGYPLCESTTSGGISPVTAVTPLPPGSPSGTRMCVSLYSTGVGDNEVRGRITGLEPEGVASITIYRLPIKRQTREDCPDSYIEGIGCPALPNEPLDEVPPNLKEIALVATFQVSGKQWGLAGSEVEPGVYLVVMETEGYRVNPVGYIVQVPYSHLAPARVERVDFTLTRTAP